MIPTDKTMVGDRVRHTIDGRRGSLEWMSDIDTAFVVWDGNPDRQVMCSWDDLVAERPGPGIGAVVAMVAAARMMVAGRNRLRSPLQPVTHFLWGWKYSPNRLVAICGDFPNGIGEMDACSADAEKVTCRDCLTQLRRIGLRGPE